MALFGTDQQQQYCRAELATPRGRAAAFFMPGEKKKALTIAADRAKKTPLAKEVM